MLQCRHRTVLVCEIMYCILGGCLSAPDFFTERIREQIGSQQGESLEASSLNCVCGDFGMALLGVCRALNTDTVAASKPTISKNAQDNNYKRC